MNRYGADNTSQNGSEGIRDSINMGNKYNKNGNARDGPRDYQPQTGTGQVASHQQQYVKGAYYGINVAPMDEGRMGSRLSPRNGQAAAA